MVDFDISTESESRRRVGSARLGARAIPGSENFGIRSVRGEAAPVVPSRYTALPVRDRVLHAAKFANDVKLQRTST